MLDSDELDRLREFHAAHFPGRPIPDLPKVDRSHPTQSSPETTANEHDNAPLGYYDDGTKRTLTDIQVKMFRHSEIQRLLQERRLAKNQKQKHHTQRRNLRPHPGVGFKSRTIAHSDEPTYATAVDTLAYDDEPTPEPTLETAVDTLANDDEPNTNSALLHPSKNSGPVFLWPQIANK
ncbi:hypothetical protein B0A52_03677 [Exophiala mesophila]|uniref:Uncharacterized protein n=1 Tax=Exophiala mesophila TaxID=212818 RepID=A0A438N9N6_EXOME|nr:hypothetical protein B0A52_03677 [Exophiala mesophila]